MFIVSVSHKPKKLKRFLQFDQLVPVTCNYIKQSKQGTTKVAGVTADKFGGLFNHSTLQRLTRKAAVCIAESYNEQCHTQQDMNPGGP
jgi:hypothetical protein